MLLKQNYVLPLQVSRDSENRNRKCPKSLTLPVPPLCPVASESIRIYQTVLAFFKSSMMSDIDHDLQLWTDSGLMSASCSINVKLIL